MWPPCHQVVNLSLPIAIHYDVGVGIREGLPKKIAVLLDFVQMRGRGGPCPNFLSTFHKLHILGQFGDGEGGGDPCPNCLAHWRPKKVVQVVQIGGRRGGQGNLDIIQKNS